VKYGFRTDVGTLRPAKRMADGRLRADAFLARPGIYEYADASYPGGVRKELREPHEQFSRETLDSFAQVPVTNEHPPKMLDAKTARDYMVGSTGESVTRDDDHMRATLMVADAKTIGEMESGKTEVSCGYSCDVDETPGEHPIYGRYDAVQKNIRGNHLAIVSRGRAGRTARVRMDEELTAAERDNLAAEKFAAPGGKLPIENADHVRAAMARFNQTDFANAAEKETARRKISAAAKRFGIDSTGFDEKYGSRSDAGINPHGGGAMDPDKLQETIRALSAQLKSAEERADTAEKALKDASARADRMDGINTGLTKKVEELNAQIASGNKALEADAVKREKERADGLQLQINRFDAELDGKVRLRCDVMHKAGAVMGAKFRMDDLSEDQIRRTVVKHLDSSVDTSTGVPAAKIEGIFDLLVEGFMKNARSLANASEVLSTAHTTESRADAREKNEQARRNAWREPLPNDIRARKDA
jgi:hypothetical protein